VPNAAHADAADNATNAGNASSLGGTAAANFLQTGCGPGKVNGYATVAGDEPGFPATFTSSAPFIKHTFNCSGQPVQVKRENDGIYLVQFPGNPGTIAVATVGTCGTELCPASTTPEIGLSFRTGGTDAGSFVVRIQPAGSAGFEDSVFTVLIP
jgi:hypothetical protein